MGLDACLNSCQKKPMTTMQTTVASFDSNRLMSYVQKNMDRSEFQLGCTDDILFHPAMTLETMNLLGDNGLDYGLWVCTELMDHAQGIIPSIRFTPVHVSWICQELCADVDAGRVSLANAKHLISKL